MVSGIAVLGIGLIAMGEEIGSEMCYRSFGHLVSQRTSFGICAHHLLVGLSFVHGVSLHSPCVSLSLCLTLSWALLSLYPPPPTHTHTHLFLPQTEQTYQGFSFK